MGVHGERWKMEGPDASFYQGFQGDDNPLTEHDQRRPGAMAADEFGKRLPELRCVKRATETSEPGNQAFADLIQEIAEPERPDLTIEKLTGVIDVLKPHLVEIYQRHMRETDQIADDPTIEILDEIVRKTKRHIAWGEEVLDRLCDTDARRQRRHARQRQLQELLEKSGGVTGDLGHDH